LFPHVPQPNVVVGANPFVNDPPAVVDEDAFTISLLTVKLIPA